jgi:hypothetical protein
MIQNQLNYIKLMQYFTGSEYFIKNEAIDCISYS